MISRSNYSPKFTKTDKIRSKILLEHNLQKRTRSINRKLENEGKRRQNLIQNYEKNLNNLKIKKKKLQNFINHWKTKNEEKKKSEIPKSVLQNNSTAHKKKSISWWKKIFYS